MFEVFIIHRLPNERSENAILYSLFSQATMIKMIKQNGRMVDSLSANELKISYAIFVPYIIQISQNLTSLQK